MIEKPDLKKVKELAKILTNGFKELCDETLNKFEEEIRNATIQEVKEKNILLQRKYLSFKDLDIIKVIISKITQRQINELREEKRLETISNE